MVIGNTLTAAAPTVIMATILQGGVHQHRWSHVASSKLLSSVCRCILWRSSSPTTHPPIGGRCTAFSWRGLQDASKAPLQDRGND
jgi:hypothetical protein